MYDGLSAVDCLRKALGNLRDLFMSIQNKYTDSLRYVTLYNPLSESQHVLYKRRSGKRRADESRNDKYTLFKEPDVREAVEKKVAEKRQEQGRANGTSGGDVEMS